MKYLLLVYSLLANPVYAQDWTREAVGLELVYQVVHGIDWLQTRDIASQCHTTAYIETNPVLGKCPSHYAVNTYFMSMAVLHLGISAILPSEYRALWQGATIVMQLGYISHNYTIGLKVNL